ncbi:hypothetical protein IGI04_033376 [Brassica rapa subsp. trilocularis]|uniref:Peptidase C1A papain C-terminal domain-containing protein n=1 Tax=Brassica rapa subsp. trilocularis TaxID=1813537 RepID=A0ABQ7L9I1_BRACM|nr:thiol protease aleurain-like isoform X3 [Brassica rapa]KAG5381906.1 hypothetical protein IGI04_033376 [Brassica rapa subsp. trilocularis]
MSLRLILSLSILLILVAAATTTEEEDIVDFLKRYVDPLEVPKLLESGVTERYKNILQLARFINEESGLPYKAAPNKFVLYTGEEVYAMLRDPQKCSTSTTLTVNQNLTEAAVPETKDWREDGIVSPVQDQGRCASGWAFSATGALEAAYHQAFGEGISLSGQQLLDCDRAFGNAGCKGGLPSQAFAYVKHNGGIATKDNYASVAEERACKFRPEDLSVNVLDSVTAGSEDELKHAVGLVRPVTVTFAVPHDFLYYKEGVFTDSSCDLFTNRTGHAGLVVGYGVENSIPYWLVKNSWGSDWGENGYFKIERGKNMCGIESCASYPLVA